MGAAGKTKPRVGGFTQNPTNHDFSLHSSRQRPIPSTPTRENRSHKTLKKTNNTQQLSRISSSSNARETKQSNNLKRSTATTQNFQVFFNG
jgi:hypothetical protein